MPLTVILRSAVRLAVLWAAGCVSAQDDARPAWHPLDAGLDELLISVRFLDEARGFAVGVQGEHGEQALLVSTRDAGAHWRRHELEGASRLYGLCFPTPSIGFPSIGYAVGQNGTVLRTRDGGERWERLDAGTTAWLSSVSFATPDLGLVAGGGELLQTRDGGAHWESRRAALPESAQTSALRDVLMRDEHTAFAVGDPGVILRTDDGGESWRLVPSGVDAWLRAVCFTPKGIGFIAGTGVMLRSRDGGATWHEIGDFSGTKLCDVVFLDERTGYACGFDGALCSTSDGGKTWPRARTETSSAINGLAFPSRDLGFAVGEDGTVLRLVRP